MKGTIQQTPLSPDSDLNEGLIESGNFLNAILDHTPYTIYVLDYSTKRIIYVNKAVKVRTGYSAEEIIAAGESIFGIFIHPDDLEAVYASMNETVSKKYINDPVFSYRIITKQGETRWIKTLNVILSSYPDGTPHQMLAIAEDVTDRVLAEEKLALSEATLSAILDSASTAHLFISHDKRIQWFNQHANNLSSHFNNIPLEVLRVVTDFVPDSTKEIFNNMVENAKNGEASSEEIFVPEVTDSKFWVKLICNPVFDNKGKNTGILFTSRDISKSKFHEQQLNLSETRLKLSLEASKQAWWDHDIERSFTITSDYWNEMNGFDTPDNTGAMHNLKERIHPDDIERIAKIVTECLQKNIPYEIEYRAKHKDGHYFWIQSRGSAVEWDKTGKASRIVGTSKDITARKNNEVDLRKAKELAETASYAKSRFLANMSHELRTPLNSIMGMTELAIDTKLDKEQKYFLNSIMNSSKSLLSQLNDILDLSKVESGKLMLNPVETEIRKFIKETIAPFGFQAKTKGLKFKKSIDKDLPRNLKTDPTRLRQIINNFLSNAIKFTDKGSVEIKIFRLADSEKENAFKMYFEISDTGIGITEDRLSDVFQEFTQLDDSHTKKYPGTGLGLSIAKGLIEKMDGENNC